MKFSHQTISLTDVLPSAIGVVVLGLLLCLTAPPSWTIFGITGWWSIPLGVCFGGSLYAFGFSFMRIPGRFGMSMLSLVNQLHGLFRRFSWFDIIVVSCLAGIGEELLIRGVLQAWLVDYFNPLNGILLASIIFGLMHSLSKVYVVLTTVLGCLFGLVFYFSQSLLLVITAHTVYDILAFFIIVKRPHLLGVNSQDEKRKLPIHEQR